MLRLSLSELPTSIAAGEQEIEVSADFRDWIKVDLVIHDTQIPEETKLPIVCQYIGIDLSRAIWNAEDLWMGIFSFYSAEKIIKDTTDSAKVSNEIAYRFDYDWWLIVAAFRQQYGINLLTVSLHWFEFKALLEGLTDQTQFIKVVQMRLRDVSKLKGDDRRQAEEAKRYWRVPSEDSVDERDPRDIEAELLAKITN